MAENTDIELSTTYGVALPGELDTLEEYEAASIAENTIAAYTRDWNAWVAWCATRGTSPRPADTTMLGVYLTQKARAGVPPTSLARYLAGIGHFHEEAGYDRPAHIPGLRRIMRGIRRKARDAGIRPVKARALDTDAIKALVSDLPAGRAGVRDRAVILVGYALGLRVSELVALEARDVSPGYGDGLDVYLASGKTDQEGKGRTLALARGTRVDTCPVTALQHWVAAAGITEGPIFRRVYKGTAQTVGVRPLDVKSVRLILQRAADRAGVSLERLSPHSLRGGHITTAYRKGTSEPKMAETTGHRSILVMRGYNDSERWENPSSANLGL